MEEYEYEIEYVGGKENKVADCLSRLFPITANTTKQAIDEAGMLEEEDTLSAIEELEKLSPQTETFDTPIIIQDKRLTK